MHLLELLSLFSSKQTAEIYFLLSILSLFEKYWLNNISKFKPKSYLWVMESYQFLLSSIKFLPYQEAICNYDLRELNLDIIRKIEMNDWQAF